MVELDVRRRRDGALVLHHDRASTPGAPLLADALELIAAAGRGAMLDVKEGGVAADLIALVDQHAPDPPGVGSGVASEALRARELRPYVRAGRTWPPRTTSGGPLGERILNVRPRARLPLVAAKLLEGFDVLVCFHRALSRVGVHAVHAADKQ